MLRAPSAARPAFLAAALLPTAASAFAQVVPATWNPEPPGGSVVINPFRESGTGSRPPLGEAGRFGLHPPARVRVLRGDGFALAALPAQETSILTAEPGILARLGKRWRADYTATWTRYSNPVFTDTFDSSLVLAGEHNAGLWRLQEQARFESSTTLLIETAAQTRTRRRGGHLAFERDIGRGNLIDATLEHTRTRLTTVGAVSAPLAPLWQESAARARLTRRLAPEFHGSAFVHLGRTDAAQSDSEHLRPGLGLRWRAGERVQLGAEYSREIRRFREEPRRSVHTDVIGVRGEYSPGSATRFAVETGRTVTPSFLPGEVNRQSLVRASLRQRLLGRLHFDATWVRRHQDSLPTVYTTVSARTDRSHTIDLNLSCGILRRLNFSLLHRSTRNTSSFAGYGFRSRQYGAELSARF
ncbi:MAG: hypothetical protein RJB55_1962 [Verrucomicrobiota bacterium]